MNMSNLLINLNLNMDVSPNLNLNNIVNKSE